MASVRTWVSPRPITSCSTRSATLPTAAGLQEVIVRGYLVAARR